MSVASVMRILPSREGRRDELSGPNAIDFAGLQKESCLLSVYIRWMQILKATGEEASWPAQLCVAGGSGKIREGLCIAACRNTAILGEGVAFDIAADMNVSSGFDIAVNIAAAGKAVHNHNAAAGREIAAQIQTAICTDAAADREIAAAVKALRVLRIAVRAHVAANDQIPLDAQCAAEAA